MLPQQVHIHVYIVVHCFGLAVYLYRVRSFKVEGILVRSNPLNKIYLSLVFKGCLLNQFCIYWNMIRLI